MKEQRTVAIVQARLHHFRVPFYEQLRELLGKENVELKLIYGQPSLPESKKNDAGHIDWAIKIKNLQFSKGPVKLLWQPYLKHLKGCDLLVVQQENRMLINYLLFLIRGWLKIKVAFWGHGINCQAVTPNGVKEKLKRALLTAPDWWFAYTDFTKEILVDAGYSEGRITLVQNAVDTTGLKTDLQSITDDERATLTEKLGIVGRKVGIYCGSLYDLKRIGFLVKAAETIREKVPDFELIIIGDGVDRPIADDAQMQHEWIHFVGTQYGRDLALYMSLGDVALMPGLVGLGVVDSFLFGMPLFTTDCGVHSPEIAYLQQGRNGYMTEDSLEAYVAKVVEVLSDDILLGRLSDNCRQDARQYTIENMAGNFAQGILKALDFSS